MPFSAYIPCCNNARSLQTAICSLQAQRPPIDDLIVVDDGSTDGSAEVAAGLGARVVRHPANLGRGAANATGLREARHEFVVCLGATNSLPPDFAARAAAWLADASVAAVFARVVGPPARNAVERWRSRHLFKEDRPGAVRHRASLITTGSLLRRAAVLAVGNFDARLRRGEDAELGERLRRAGWDVVADPALQVVSRLDHTLGAVLERYARWNAGASDGRLTPGAYARLVGYSLKVMAREDLRARDPWCVPISLLCPHYQFWSARGRRPGA